MATKTKADGEQVKPPGHALLEKMVNHHKDMIEGVASELPMVEVPETREGIKKFCGVAHKGMSELIGTHGKAYGLKMADMPDALATSEEEGKKGEGEEKPKPNPEDTDSDLDMKEELPDGEDAMEDEEDMTDDEEKAFEAQIKALEEQTEAEELVLKSAGLLTTK